jgi:hypothetical protein
MIDRFVSVAPGFQRVINGVLIGKNERTRSDGLTNEGLNGRLLDISKHPDDDFPTSLNHAQDGWLFLRQRATPTLAFQPSASSNSSLLKHHFRMPLVSSDDIYLVTLHFPAQLDGLFLSTIPSRSWLAMSCTAP